jgi:prepilin-type processing-associated H-X9-DG protein
MATITEAKVSKLKGREKKRLRVPFEATPERWREELKPFRCCVYRSLPLDVRKYWMSLPRLNEFRIFSCGYYLYMPHNSSMNVAHADGSAGRVAPQRNDVITGGTEYDWWTYNSMIGWDQ